MIDLISSDESALARLSLAITMVTFKSADLTIHRLLAVTWKISSWIKVLMMAETRTIVTVTFQVDAPLVPLEIPSVQTEIVITQVIKMKDSGETFIGSVVRWWSVRNVHYAALKKLSCVNVELQIVLARS